MRPRRRRDALAILPPQSNNAFSDSKPPSGQSTVGMSRGLSIQRSIQDQLVRFPVSSRGLAYEVTQLGAGRILQKRTIASMENFTAIVGGFTVGLRSRGVFSSEHLTLISPAGPAERMRFWSRDVPPGGLFLCPLGAEHDTAYFGPASYAGLSLKPDDLVAILGGEPQLGDPGFWNVRQWVQPDRQVSTIAQRRLGFLLSQLDTAQAILSPEATDFWKRSIVEIFAVPLLHALPPVRENPVRSYPSLVREVERYLDERASRPIHISEICSTLNVSRRALHRAFDDVLGIGPVAFFRRKRLHAAFSALQQASGPDASVTAIAMEHGFTELGHFSQAYRALFGETPSQTLARSPR